VIDMPAGSGGESARLGEARSRAGERLRRQRDTLRPLGLAAALAVAASAVSDHPAPGLQGESLGVTLSLCIFAGTLAVAVAGRFAERSHGYQAAVIAVMGAAGVALVALQPQGATGLAAAAAVWMAVARLPLLGGVALATVITVALDAALALSGGTAAGVIATTLLCALLALVALFLRQARASQDRTELLLAELDDAREQQLQAAAIEERGRIASELHDVLAHSLSGAAIQLQGARLLAQRDHAAPELQTAIARASELVKDGLANAKQAVGALRGRELPGLAQLESLVASFRDDLQLDVSLTIEGTARVLPAEAGLALYRGAQEALTNVARYAPAASTNVVVRYGDDRTTLTVEDRVADGPPPSAGGLEHVGGGRGLAGMRERIERLGGTAQAGPTEAGWRVELTIPG
jgi:signal transduction histidine kinase